MKENPELFDRYFVREKVIDVIRSFFKGQGFHEAHTPVLVPIPSAESNLEVFETKLNTATGLSRRGFLIMSPEYALKKLLAAGIGSVFEVTRCFRNEEEVSRAHNPEFTMLEWYRVGATYMDIMNDFESMFTSIIKTVNPNANLSCWVYQQDTYDLTTPWPRISVAQAFQKYANIDVDSMLDDEKLKQKAVEFGYTVDNATTWEQVFYQIFFNKIEPELKNSKRPTFIYDYPLSQAALARRKQEDPRFAERFEIFLAGLELGNCFSELTDPNEQAFRFTTDLAERKRLHKTDYPMDDDFIRALESGMPEVAGIAVGLDRLVMLAADAETIADTLFFPASELFDLKG